MAFTYFQLSHDGRERRYAVYQPERADSAENAKGSAPPQAAPPMPVVLALHGAGGTARFLLQESGLEKIADAQGFLLVLPEGDRADPARIAQFEHNPQTWNDGSGRFFSGEQRIDDVGFLCAVIDDVASRFSVDRDRTYMVGISNGGSMTFRVATEQPARIRAIAVIAGYWMQPVSQLTTPRSLLYIMGAADPIAPINGGEVQLPWGSMGYRPPPRDSVVAWAKACGCPRAPVVRDVVAGVTCEDFCAEKSILRRASSAVLESVHQSQTASDAAIRIISYTVEDLGHVWPGGRPILPEALVGPHSDRLLANEVIWEFFANI